MTKLSLNDISVNAGALNKFVGDTIKAYKAVGVSLHQAACMLFVHVAEGNDPGVLNQFYNGLRVNDQTALRVWFGQHASYIDLSNMESRNWIKFSTKEGFSLVKGTHEHRAGKYTVEAIEGDNTKTVMIGVSPFYEKNVKDKDALTVDELVKMLAAAANRVTKKAKDENIQLPADILKLTTEMTSVTAKVGAELARIEK